MVISLDVVEHLYAPRDHARALANLLEPGENVHRSPPSHGYWKNLVLALLGKMDAHSALVSRPNQVLVDCNPDRTAGGGRLRLGSLFAGGPYPAAGQVVDSGRQQTAAMTGGA